ncbi:hypothetical protein [Brevibacterium oceani]|uniref:hypothetical protein n=1 Tax=Brevibacterium oceani TaxID=358099 RepID=UPI0015E78539|nr:hypothetical protein [Brevibacterium oceani]
MPEYRIVSEADPGPDHREPRGARLRLDEAREVTVTEARNVSDLIEDIERGLPAAGDARAHQTRRIVAIEEVHPGFSYADDEIGRALGTAETSPTGEQLVDPMGSTGEPHDPDLVAQVVNGLRESGLVPGLNISVLANEPDEPYAMVEVFDDALGAYRSIGTEVRKIADDRDAEPGWDAVLSIARGLISLSNDLH